MNSPIFSRILAKLRTRDVPLAVIARGAGVPYDTLKKISTGVISNPGIRHVERLYLYFDLGAQPREHDKETRKQRQ